MRKKNKGLRFRMTAIAVALASAALLLVGCGQKSSGVSRADNHQAPLQQELAVNVGNDEQKPDISAKPAETRQTVTLYFGDDQAMYLAAEQREVTKGDEPLEAVIVRELIKGPKKESLTRTIPEGTQLLSVSVVNSVAYINFSREFKAKHWGGSAGEIMTIYSVANSLGKLPGIEKVQFLVEGAKQESILGNIGTMEPVAPDWKLVQK